MAEWLEYLNDHLKACGKTCLTQDEIDRSKTKFLIDCPLICSNPRSREIIKLFEDVIPRCGVSSYSWYPISSCYRGDLIYTKVKIVIDGVETIVLVPPTATIDDMIDLGIPNPYATDLFNSRVVEVDSVNCCQYETVNPPYLDIINITTNSVTLSYVLQNNQAAGALTLNGQTINVTEPSGTVTFTGLTLSTEYTITFTVTNCAGSITINRNFSTLPYFVTIVLGPNITGNISFANNLVVGVNQFNFYCTQVNISWTGINNIHEVTEFLVDGQNRLNDVTWNQVVNTKNIGGTFTIPCIDKDYTIYIEGVRALDCDDIQTNINGNTITISL